MDKGELMVLRNKCHPIFVHLASSLNTNRDEQYISGSLFLGLLVRPGTDKIL